MHVVVGILAVLAILVVLSTLTTAFIEVVHAVFRQRVRGLKSMLRAMYDQLFAKEKAASQDAGGAATFIKEMTSNPAQGEARSDALRNYLLPYSAGNTGRFDELSVRQFVQQFANSTLGGALVNVIAALPQADQAAALGSRLTEIVTQFERYCEASRQLFRRRAGITSALAGIGLAACLNVDGALVTERLFNNTALASEVVLKLSAEELQRRIDEAAAFQCSGTAAGTPEHDACVAEAKKNPAAIRISGVASEFEALGLPVGQAYFPFCRAGDDNRLKDPRCGAAAGSEAWSGSLAAWIVSIIVTGALLGLGAPFWFDIYQRIAALAPLTGLPANLLKAIKAQPPAGGNAPAPPAPQDGIGFTSEQLAQIFTLARSK